MSLIVNKEFKVYSRHELERKDLWKIQKDSTLDHRMKEDLRTGIVSYAR